MEEIETLDVEGWPELEGYTVHKCLTKTGRCPNKFYVPNDFITEENESFHCLYSNFEQRVVSGKFVSSWFYRGAKED